MMMLIAATALAGAQPATPPSANPVQHGTDMQMGKDMAHEGMDCCKDCCKDMAAKHDGHDMVQPGHSSH